MSNFCPNCGSVLDENGFCRNCGSSFAKNQDYDDQIYTDENGRFVDAYGNPIPPENLPPMNDTYNNSSNSSGPQNYAFHNNDFTDQKYEYSYQNNSSGDNKVNVAEFFKESVGTSKKFFTATPIDMVNEGIKDKGYSWTIFAALTAVMGALCTTGVVGNFIEYIFDAAMDIFPYASYLFKTYSFGNMFFMFIIALLFYAALFFAKSGCYYTVMIAMKKKLSFVENMKAVAVSYFPMAVACAAAYILSFILLPISFVLILAGYLASMAMLKESIKQQADEEPPFWLSLLNSLIQAIVSVIVIFIVIRITV